MNFLRSVFAVSFVLISTTFAKASPVQDVSIIVRLIHAANDQELATFEVSGFHLREPLNPERTIYKLSFKSSYMSMDQAFGKLQQLNFVDLVQEDFQVQLRASTPNDPNYQSQWHLPLIKANMAWDFVRSGLNRRGDTIVIAVVDDGVHTNHPDFQGNLWINYADTIDNGKDDDGNGYIDDTYGWNFQSNNKDISDSNYYRSKHGTPVAGIIGAVTNNHTGISGIMWKVKLMIVNIADTGVFPVSFQSDVIRAYSYLLHQRKLYNMTNGEKGAFVVAENSSWGADNKRPSQAPLWCAFYDSLGKYGILSVGATSNSQKDVDVSGDMPSLCPSDHLIVVGASTLNDNYGGCGYSTISVDLSAPGYNIFTSAPYTKENIQTGNIYRAGYSGTSFAAPMVTAAIGVLHAYACDRLLDTIKANPAKGNLVIRKMILEGVDEVPSLIGKSVTSGRLNLLKSIQLLNGYCAGDVGLEEVAINNKIGVYPNPFNGLGFQIHSESQLISAELFDVSGKLVQVSHQEGTMETGPLRSGVYVLKITTSAGVDFVKVVCQN